jgi:enoyl-CoA hydratase
MSSSTIQLELRDAVALVTLDRPDAMNALSARLREELAAAFRTLESDPAIRVAILTGAGRAFCAGFDLKELAAGTTGQTVDSAASDMEAAIADFSGPIIGAVNGHAITGGFELALACDILIASEQARFADTHARVGILPGWGLSQKLPRMIGVGRAKELSFTGNFIDARQALEWGLVNRVVPGEVLLPDCWALAEEMASCVPAVLRGYKRLIDEGLRLPLGDALRMEHARSLASAGSVAGSDVAGRRKNVTERGRSSA